jgi:hypothetical protein
MEILSTATLGEMDLPAIYSQQLVHGSSTFLLNANLDQYDQAI